MRSLFSTHYPSESHTTLNTPDSCAWLGSSWGTVDTIKEAAAMGSKLTPEFSVH